MVPTEPSGFTPIESGSIAGLTVFVDRLFADLSTARVATFATADIGIVNAPSHPSFPGVAGPFFGVNWTPASPPVGMRYRITVGWQAPPGALSAPFAGIGVADVQVVATPDGGALVDRTTLTPLVAGATLPIVFRLTNRDSDGDAISDWRDNCPFTRNAPQLDSDLDGRPDACPCLGAPNGTPCRVLCRTGQCQSGSCALTGFLDDGKACNGGHVCKQNETCASGVCTGGTSKPDGTPCTTGSPCRAAETCSGGTCSGGTPRTGATCSTGSPCKTGETCSGTLCGGGTILAPGTPCSTKGNPCMTGEVCSATGTCGGTATPKPDGTACGDGNLCTRGDTCQSGACAGSSPISCVANGCHMVGTCDRNTGLCPAVVAAGLACSAANACNGAGTCDGGGSCQSGPPVVRSTTPIPARSTSATLSPASSATRPGPWGAGPGAASR